MQCAIRFAENFPSKSISIHSFHIRIYFWYIHFTFIVFKFGMKALNNHINDWKQKFIKFMCVFMVIIVLGGFFTPWNSNVRNWRAKNQIWSDNTNHQSNSLSFVPSPPRNRLQQLNNSFSILATGENKKSARHNAYLFLYSSYVLKCVCVFVRPSSSSCDSGESTTHSNISIDWIRIGLNIHTAF